MAAMTGTDAATYTRERPCAAGAWHGRGLVCYASSGKEGNRRLPEQILSDADPQLESPTAAKLKARR